MYEWAMIHKRSSNQTETERKISKWHKRMKLFTKYSVLLPTESVLRYVRRCLLPGCQGPRIAAESWRVGLFSDQLTVSLRKTRGLSKKAEMEQLDRGPHDDPRSAVLTAGSVWRSLSAGEKHSRRSSGTDGLTDWLSLETSEPHRWTKYRPQWGVGPRAHPSTTGPLVNVTWLKVCQSQSMMLC